MSVIHVFSDMINYLKISLTCHSDSNLKEVWILFYIVIAFNLLQIAVASDISFLMALFFCLSGDISYLMPAGFWAFRITSVNASRSGMSDACRPLLMFFFSQTFRA